MEIFKDKSTSGYLFGGTPYIKSKDVNGNIIYIDPMTGKTVRTEERNGTTYQASAKIKKDQRIREDVRKKHNLRINSGQSIMVGGREVRIGSPKLHYISLSTDNRPLYMKDASKQSYELEYKQLQLDEAEKKTLGALGAFSSYLFPSTYLGALTDLLEGKKSFLGSLVEGNEGLGNPVANLAADIITPYGISKGLNLLANAGKTFGKVGNKALNFLNSPYTGKWTQFGSRQYRFKPGYLGMNGTPVESRKVGDYSIGIDLNKTRSIFEDYEKGLTQYKGNKSPSSLEYNYERSKIDFDNLVKDNFVEYLSQQTGRKIKRVPIKDTKHGDIYNEGFAFVDDEGKELAHIAGSRKGGKNVYVESSYVDPEFRYKGLGKQMYFDLNDHVFSTYGTTLRSNPMQRVGSTGIGMSPSNRLWKSLRDNGMSTVEGEGFNRYDIMAEPSKIITAYRKTSTAPQITAKNAASITPEQWNAAYKAAYETGNKAEGQRLWDLWYKLKTQDNKIITKEGMPLRVSRASRWGNNIPYNIFDKTKGGNYRGFYFGNKNAVVDRYGKTNLRDFYLNSKNPFTENNFNVLQSERSIIPQNDGMIYAPGGINSSDFEVKVFEPNLIKSAEPFTLDDSGELIPLSQRANFDSNDIRYFKDEYGREVTPTPWKGSDLSLLDLIPENLINIIKHYFSPEKTQQIKKAMGWGDKEYSEFLDELLRILQNLATGEVKGPEDGFTIFALHKGYGIGKGPNMVGKHIMTFNRERIPDKKFAVESIIHELGGHGKTMGIDPSKPSVLSEAFPRMTELMKKNLELADEILLFNKRGKFWNLFPKASDLELYLDKKHLSPEKIELFFDKRRYFLYMVKDIQEKVARGYTGLLMDKLGYDKTMNIKLLEKYFTPESVEKFKNAVLNYGTPIIGGTSAYSLYNMLQNNNNQINLKRKGGKLHKYQWGNKILNYINNGFDKPRELYNLKLNSSPVNINNLVKYKDEYDNIFMDLKLLKTVDNYMIKRNVGLPQRQAILYTIWLEGSKIGPHGNGASGLVGWKGLRAKGLPNTIEGQAEKLYNEAFGSFNSNNWNHGGEGSGYKSGKEALQAFLNAKTYNDAVRALNYGYVRPDPNSLKKRITSTVFQMKKGGKLLKLQQGSTIYNDYSIGNNSSYVDNKGYLHNPNTGDYGSVMLPEIVVNKKGNITTRTLLKRELGPSYDDNDLYNFIRFLGYNQDSTNKILEDGHKMYTNNINSPSRNLSNKEIEWSNKYIKDKFSRNKLKDIDDSFNYYSKLNPINKGLEEANSWEEYELNRMKNSFNKAKQDLIKYYNSPAYQKRLFNLGPSLLFSSSPNKNVLNNISVIPYKEKNNVFGLFRHDNDKNIFYNIDLDIFNVSPYETLTHELSHAFDYHNPMLNKYNQKYIKLNPYLSNDDLKYLGKPTEIRARAMEVLMDYLNNKDKYNSIEDFIDKESENHTTIKELKYIFKDEKSLFDYMNNFVQNDITPIDKFKNYYAKQGGKLL